MSNALFAFDDPHAGQRAAERLIEHGTLPDAVRVHRHERYEESFGRKADEQITGGLVSNVLDLFQGIFDFGSSPHDAAAFEETVRRGGVVVSVDADSDDECSAVEQVMLAAGCDQHTAWSQAPAR